jgi:hypothetical protein
MVVHSTRRASLDRPECTLRTPESLNASLTVVSAAWLKPRDSLLAGWVTLNLGSRVGARAGLGRLALAELVEAFPAAVVFVSSVRSCSDAGSVHPGRLVELVEKSQVAALHDRASRPSARPRSRRASAPVLVSPSSRAAGHQLWAE